MTNGGGEEEDPHAQLQPQKEWCDIEGIWGRWFQVNLLSGRLYASVLGGEDFVAESGGEC